jgi:hypothetical protein
MTRSDLLIYEYACHEGNHDFRFILAGARNLERREAAVNRRTESTEPALMHATTGGHR